MMVHYFHLQVISKNHYGGVTDYPFSQKFPICKKKFAIKKAKSLKKDLEYMDEVRLTKVHKKEGMTNFETIMSF